MKFKRIIAIITAVAAFALPASAELRWGITAGTNISDYHFSQKLIATQPLVGANAGVMAELMFPGIGFGIDFGLKYQLHGANLDLGAHKVWAVDGYGNEKCQVHSLHIPINLRFKYTNLMGVERYVAPLAYAGPVFAFTLAHNNLPPVEFPAGNVGVQVGLGGEFFEHLQLTAGYYWGLTYEIKTYKLDNMSARIEGWQINLAWLF